ncbi:tigger transposable element-derived protein 6 [Ixodes scapularis]|uniref:tigger transposable element-derived protein 6 n=1 Tax=Ixodes scapularis TaxID=6945 RepID=UPI001AD73992|nr:tigger transposable element-derived protein 6 [Ixodes scapularis]
MTSRKRKALSFKEKFDILRTVDRNPSRKRSEVARELGLAPSTLNSIVARRKEIEAKAPFYQPGFKQARGAKHAKLEEALLVWFKQARASCVNIDGGILREKAQEIADRLDIADFTCSNGWVDRFRKRHGISYRAVSGEAASVDPICVEAFKSSLPSIIAEYHPRDVFNADEAGLFFNVQPTKSLSLKGEACHGGKSSKERLTVLLCCNEDGSEMMKPWVIGKFRNPRCLKNLRRMPCHYRNNTRAWMTSALFEEFLRYLDSRMGSQNRKALLFIDNCPAHPKELSFLRNVRVEYLPPNATSHLQPLDAGIIKNVKHFYRKWIVRRSLAMVERGDAPTKLSILDAMHFLATAWDTVSATTVQHCFRKCGFQRAGQVQALTKNNADEDADDSQEMEDAMAKMGAPITYCEYASLDDNVVTSEPQSIADIVADLTTADNEESDEEDEQKTNGDAAPTFADAIAALDTLRRYVNVHDCAESERGLRLLEKRLLLHTINSKRQVDITRFCERV